MWEPSGSPDPVPGTPTRTVPLSLIGVRRRLLAQYRTPAMSLNALSRLDDLHSRFNLLRGLDNAVLKANGFDASLEELASVITGLKSLSHTQSQLSSLHGALELLLMLLEVAHARDLSGDHLHCLLEPLRVKLDGALNELDSVI